MKQGNKVLKWPWKHQENAQGTYDTENTGTWGTWHPRKPPLVIVTHQYGLGVSSQTNIYWLSSHYKLFVKLVEIGCKTSRDWLSHQYRLVAIV